MGCRLSGRKQWGGEARQGKNEVLLESTGVEGGLFCFLCKESRPAAQSRQQRAVSLQVKNMALSALCGGYSYFYPDSYPDFPFSIHV